MIIVLIYESEPSYRTKLWQKKNRKIPRFLLNKAWGPAPSQVPRRIFETNNATKLVLIVRNPVDRLVSDYNQFRTRKLDRWPLFKILTFFSFFSAEVKTIPVLRSSCSLQVATLISVIRWEDDRNTCQAVCVLTEISPMLAHWQWLKQKIYPVVNHALNFTLKIELYWTRKFSTTKIVHKMWGEILN